ncbi:MAG: arsenate reductase ArsC [Anaerolineae bacterium]|nr:arsenate reductase ArsC [Anaerolineae bacterium]
MKHKVLILCTANSARSQMAEGLLRHLAGDYMEVHSAGSKPSVVNPFAIQAMEKRGIDITGHRSKHLSEYLQASFDYVITVCDNAAETCPVFPGKAERIHWGFPDPAGVEGNDEDILNSFISVRDGLEKNLSEWVDSLEKVN